MLRDAAIAKGKDNYTFYHFPNINDARRKNDTNGQKNKNKGRIREERRKIDSYRTGMYMWYQQCLNFWLDGHLSFV